MSARNAMQPLLAALLGCAACGPSAGRVAAEETLRTASSALAELDTAGAEVPAVAHAVEEASGWLSEAERAVDLWGNAPRSLAYETVAPCLARALDDVRRALTDAGRDVPATLESAQAGVAAVSDASCPPRRSR
jgi:hypothetical protein